MSDQKKNEDDEYDESYEPTLEDFLEDEEEDDSKKKFRNKWSRKFIIGMLIFVMFVSTIQIWPQILNLSAINFLKTSYQLSQEETVQNWKQSIVTVKTDNGKGTGFNITEDGFIVTNEHVIDDAVRIHIHFPDGTVYVPTKIEKFADLDIAFIDIEGENLPQLSLQDKKKWNEGDEIYFIGNPLAYNQIANIGEILGTTTVSSIIQPAMMLKAPVYNGNSGSPVINKEGFVIGVIFATMPTEEYGRVGLAIPVEEIIPILDLEY